MPSPALMIAERQSRASRWGLGKKPTICSTGWPSLKRMRVGIPITRKRQAASVEPQGLSRVVKDIRVWEAARGDGEKRVYESELPAMDEPKHGYAAEYADGRLYVFGGSRCSG